MKAILCTRWGLPADLQLSDLSAPEIGARQVLVDVHAAGLNFPDVLIIQGKYQFKPPFPFAPGGEVAGVVRAIGEKVQHVKPGDRVMALTGHGGFAEQVAADALACLPIPEGMDFVTAAGFTMTYGTTYHALVDRAALKAGEWLLVTGAGGGVGLNAVELGRILGARVIAAAGSDAKLAAAKAAGAHELINYATENLADRVKAITGDGANVIYDAVGGDVFDQCMKAIAWEGRALVIGFASGRIPEIPANRILLKGCAVVGVFWGAFAMRDPAANRRNFEALFALYAEGKLKPKIGRVYEGLGAAPGAITDLMERNVTGKAVVKIC